MDRAKLTPPEDWVPKAWFIDCDTHPKRSRKLIAAVQREARLYQCKLDAEEIVGEWWPEGSLAKATKKRFDAIAAQIEEGE